LFLLENVKMKTEWQDVITEHLGVQPIEINSELLSAQNRKRLYWTNINGVEQPKDKGVKLQDILEEVPVDDTFIKHEGIFFEFGIPEVSRKLVKCVGDEIRISQAVKRGYITAENGDGINLSFPNSKTRRGRVIRQKSSTVDCACDICVLHNGVIRRFTVKELERLQTLPDGYTKGFPKIVVQKAIGNGWTVDVIAHILSYIPNGKERSENMKETTMYICECCNRKHSTKENAEACEQRHKKIIKISNAEYKHTSKHPHSISVEMEDGEIVEYVRK
jgi:DNA (cytosine-5)-methyltransferase 3A